MRERRRWVGERGGDRWERKSEVKEVWVGEREGDREGEMGGRERVSNGRRYEMEREGEMGGKERQR